MLNVKKVFNSLQILGGYSNIQKLLDDLNLNRNSYNTSVRENSLSTKTLNKILELCINKSWDLNKVFLNNAVHNQLTRIELIENEVMELKKELRV